MQQAIFFMAVLTFPDAVATTMLTVDDLVVHSIGTDQQLGPDDQEQNCPCGLDPIAVARAAASDGGASDRKTPFLVQALHFSPMKVNDVALYSKGRALVCSQKNLTPGSNISRILVYLLSELQLGSNFVPPTVEGET